MWWTSWEFLEDISTMPGECEQWMTGALFSCNNTWYGFGDIHDFMEFVRICQSP